jgi:prepilin-type N-terminal cleavage/methylation domain-containing protein
LITNALSGLTCLAVSSGPSFCRIRPALAPPKARFLPISARDKKYQGKDLSILMNTTRKKNRGFTLAELMIVILIIGLITALSLPGYSRFLQSWKLNGEAEQFAATMRTARSAAIMKNLNAVFTFNVNARTFFYFEDNDRDGIRDNNEYQSATYRLIPQIEFAAHTLSGTTLTFGPMGNTSANGSITLRNTRKSTKIIRIYGGTGNITID